LINDVVIACKAISSAVRYGSLVGVLGTADTENIQGETQKKLDVIANNLFIKRNEWAGHVAAMASEEMSDVYHLPSQYPRGKYLLVFDPLDGSSNTDVNGAVGTIFSILRRPEGAVGEATEDDFLQPGAPAGLRRLRFVWSVLDDGAHHRPRRQRLHPGPTHRRVHPDQPQHANSRRNRGFSINASYMRFWDPPVRRYIDECLAGKEGPRRKDFNMRWAGAMIADVHRVLTRGGVFLYPIDRKLRAKNQEASCG
jgi:fructose-1,6-bisphosphatase I